MTAKYAGEDMLIIPRRLQIIAPGGVAVAALSLLEASWSVREFLPDADPAFTIRFCLLSLLAPLVFITNRFHELFSVGPMPVETLTIAIAAIIGVPMHTIFCRRWAAAVTIVGLACWFLCASIVAGSLG